MSHRLKVTITLTGNEVDVDYDNPGSISAWETIGILELTKQLLIRDEGDEQLESFGVNNLLDLSLELALTDYLSSYLGDEWTDQVVIFYLPECRRLSDLRNERNKEISGDLIEGDVFFIDLRRDISWPHPCLYLRRSAAGTWLLISCEDCPPIDGTVLRNLHLERKLK